jgi:phosphatidate cytidylyltransferase
MADAEAPSRKRDRLKARARRYMTVPLRVRTADLPKRAASALVMLALVALAVWLGGAMLQGFIALVALVCYAEFARLVGRATRSWAGRLLAWLAGAAYIGLAAWALAGLSPYHLVMVLGTVIMTDTCAYFTGRSIGGPKIAPSISPSKTWAGLGGGMAGSALWLEGYMAFGYNADGVLSWAERFTMTIAEAIGWAVIGALMAVAAQAGDFFESWLKRRAGVKDSSKLIPGHGGVFDRVDGMLPVAIIVGALAAYS